ncbi:hypothetical protein BB559_003160 [Furculomyces boomerangus]|uniref:Uncharacterized protein n=1 Tax=Furculomyces boomerangus TaxID=61424 RepID=A0A2T9YN74_9FUNG|nr:hypothetical protein BB559_003160 [Furculomyces boomerangus]
MVINALLSWLLFVCVSASYNNTCCFKNSKVYKSLLNQLFQCTIMTGLKQCEDLKLTNNIDNTELRQMPSVIEFYLGKREFTIDRGWRSWADEYIYENLLDKKYKRNAALISNNDFEAKFRYKRNARKCCKRIKRRRNYKYV